VTIFRARNPADGFVWTEIVCESGEAAESEAQRQKERDSPGAEWIYLRNANGEWVARRTPRHFEPETIPEGLLRTSPRAVVARKTSGNTGA
jgi:hypothetical protein